MYALAASLPIVAVIVLIGALRWGSGRALPCAWLLAAAVAVVFWEIPFARVLAYPAFGALQAFDILVIIFGAIVLLNTLEQSGAMRSSSLPVGADPARCRWPDIQRAEPSPSASGSGRARSPTSHERADRQLRVALRPPGG